MKEGEWEENGSRKEYVYMYVYVCMYVYIRSCVYVYVWVGKFYVYEVIDDHQEVTYSRKEEWYMDGRGV